MNKILSLFFIVCVSLYANEQSDIPFVNIHDKPSQLMIPKFKVVNGKIIVFKPKLSPELYNIKESLASIKPSTLDYDLQTELCIVTTSDNATKERVKMIDRLLSHNDVKYKIYKTKPNGFRDVFGEIKLYILRIDSIKVASIFTAAEKDKLFN